MVQWSADCRTIDNLLAYSLDWRQEAVRAEDERCGEEMLVEVDPDTSPSLLAWFHSQVAHAQDSHNALVPSSGSDLVQQARALSFHAATKMKGSLVGELD